MPCIIHHLLEWHQFETDMGFLSSHQNHVTKIVGAMWSNNQTSTGQTGKVKQGTGSNNPCKNDVQRLLSETLRAIIASKIGQGELTRMSE